MFTAHTIILSGPPTLAGQGYRESALVRRRWRTNGEPIRDIARRFNVSHSTILRLSP